LLLLHWPLAVKKKKPLHLLQLWHLLQLLLPLKLLLLLLHQSWLLLLHPLWMLLALLPTRLLTLLLTLPKLLLPSNQLFVDLTKPPSGGFVVSGLCVCGCACAAGQSSRKTLVFLRVVIEQAAIIAPDFSITTPPCCE
jgi:hypothetical protein